MVGSHLIKSWSQDQIGAPERISGEAELYAANIGMSESMGLMSLTNIDMGTKPSPWERIRGLCCVSMEVHMEVCR